MQGLEWQGKQCQLHPMNGLELGGGGMLSSPLSDDSYKSFKRALLSLLLPKMASREGRKLKGGTRVFQLAGIFGLVQSLSALCWCPSRCGQSRGLSWNPLLDPEVPASGWRSPPFVTSLSCFQVSSDSLFYQNLYVLLELLVHKQPLIWR